MTAWKDVDLSSSIDRCCLFGLLGISNSRPSCVCCDLDLFKVQDTKTSEQHRYLGAEEACPYWLLFPRGGVLRCEPEERN